MRKVLRWTGYVVASLVLLVLLAAAAAWLLAGEKLSAHGNGKPEHLAKPTPAQLADASRELIVLRCAGCHNEGLRGDLFFDAPHVAKIYAPNLTQVAAKATDEQLARAIRQGIGVDERSLVIMPSDAFSRLDDSEVAVLIAVIRALPKVGNAMPPPQVGILGRVGLVIGKFHTAPEEVGDYARKLPIDLGPQYARGRHLAASNCAECHGPDLAGGEAEPGLNAPDLTIAGAYDLPGFTKLMRTGVPAGGRKLKMMDEVSREGFSHYTDDEIAAIHAYLVAGAQKLTR
jgi:mono/diheme cytochrome c family protein